MRFEVFVLSARALNEKDYITARPEMQPLFYKKMHFSVNFFSSRGTARRIVPENAAIYRKRSCQANNTDLSRIKRRICARRFPKGDAPNGRRKRSESPLVGRWGKAPYPKMLRHLFLKMFGLSLTASCFSTKGVLYSLQNERLSGMGENE